MSVFFPLVRRRGAALSEMMRTLNSFYSLSSYNVNNSFSLLLEKKEKEKDNKKMSVKWDARLDRTIGSSASTFRLLLYCGVRINNILEWDIRTARKPDQSLYWNRRTQEGSPPSYTRRDMMEQRKSVEASRGNGHRFYYHHHHILYFLIAIGSMRRLCIGKMKNTRRSFPYWKVPSKFVSLGGDLYCPLWI